MTEYPKRLIEVDLPINLINRAVSLESHGRKGHPSSLHKWWATKPLASCRATVLSSVLPDPEDEHASEEYTCFVEALDSDAKDGSNLRAKLTAFLAEYCMPINSNSRIHRDKLKRLLKTAGIGGCSGKEMHRLSILDPFCGTSAFVLESLRLLNCCGMAFDYNPVAVIISKCLLEDIPKVNDEFVQELAMCSERVLENAIKRISNLYPLLKDKALAKTYLWYRTCICEGPGCGKTIPLTGTFWLHKGHFAVQPVHVKGNLDFEFLECPSPQGVPEGTVKRSSATCPFCGYTTPRKKIVEQGVNQGLEPCLVAIRDTNGSYHKPTEADKQAIVLSASAGEYLRGKQALSLTLPYLRSIFNVHIYGIRRWSDLYLPRQLAALTALAESVRNEGMLLKENNHRFAREIVSLLALAVDYAAMANCTQTRWRSDNARTESAFSVQALPMIWNFAEDNFSLKSSSFKMGIERIVKVISNIQRSDIKPGIVGQANAQLIPLPDDCVDVVVTDPPYYDAVPYGNLSDFFYVWLKMMLDFWYPDLFRQSEVEKDHELVQLAERNVAYKHKTKGWFEEQMREALTEIRRVAKPDGLMVLAYAHKETSSWEALLGAIISAGWRVVASWPIDTELSTRMRAQNSAVLASTIHLVCRPNENVDGSLITDYIGDWRDVLAELPNRVHEWMPRLAEEGVVGADAIFACLGPALEIFSRYSKVEKASGEQVTLKEYLEHVWAAVEKEALNMIFEGADAAGFEEDSRLTAMWLWTLSTGANGNGKKESAGEKTKKSAGYTLEFDAARKIAQGLGAHLENLGRVVEIKGDKARLLSVAERTKYLFGKDESQAPVGRRKKKDQQEKFDFAKEVEQAEAKEGGWGEKSAPRAGETVLDQLHQAMILFASGRGEAMKRFLVEEGVGRDGRFWRLAQALSALYPTGTDEKRWVDGVLARKKGLGF